MEDVTDTAFRRIVGYCSRPDVYFTEFTSTDGLFSEGRSRVIHRLDYTEEERPLVAQIWGNKPENYYKAGKLLKEMKFDGIDINMGCPVPKIVKKGGCSALIDNPGLAKELYLAVKEGSGLPVSIKTRLGFKELKTEEWVRFILDLNPAALILHGRLAKDMSKKPANWDEIAKASKIKKELQSDTVLIGNGDVRSYNEILEKTEKYNVDGVMIGRGIFENLYLFSEDKNYHDLELKDKFKLLNKHLDLFSKRWGSNRKFSVMKKFFGIYIRDFKDASELRIKLMESKTIPEAQEILNNKLEEIGI
ncbi:UNVERIFIED_CONTAM: hypothetical protein GTU68_039200 [Idotea baltica]|nr:hypothetical protein [Idotea baltica]